MGGSLGSRIGRRFVLGIRGLIVFVLILAGLILGVLFSPVVVMMACFHRKRSVKNQFPKPPRQTVIEIRGGRVIERGLTPVERLGALDEAMALYGFTPDIPWNRNHRGRRP